MIMEDIKEKCKALGVLMKVQTGEEHEIDDKMASAVKLTLNPILPKLVSDNRQLPVCRTNPQQTAVVRRTP